MAEYIEREALRKSLLIGAAYLDEDTMMTVVNVLDCFPAAEVAPVRHGRWKYYRKQGIAVCTQCSFERKLDDDFGRAVSCPNCGAKMDGDSDG